MLPAASLWTLDELCDRAAEALAGDAPKGRDGRVREVPDRRTVRYYTTLGLVDRPSELRGRTAYYGRKHLLQLAAVKRLQAAGLTLAQVQQRLLGLTEDELRPLARLPDDPEAPRAAAPEPAARREDFWRTVPAPPPDSRPAGGGEPARADVTGLRLGPQVVLLLEGARPLREEDRAAIRGTAAALLDLLEARGVLRPGRPAGEEDNGNDTTP